MKKTLTRVLVLALLLITILPVTKAFADTEDFYFTREKTEMTAGKKYRFETNLGLEGNVIWESSDTKIAVVKPNGKVKAKRSGTVIITATSGPEVISREITIRGKKKIGLDPGHQNYGNWGTEPNGPGSTTMKTKVSGGTKGVSTGKTEGALNLEIAKKVKNKLEKQGYEVVMTRTSGDVDISNKERAELINESGADICVRIHADGLDNSSVTGATVLCPSSSNPYISHLYKKSYSLSECIIEAYCEATGIKSRGIALRDDLTGTNWSSVPTTLIELGFMTNSTEDKFMASKEGQKAMSDGIVEGINRYFGY